MGLVTVSIRQILLISCPFDRISNLCQITENFKNPSIRWKKVAAGFSCFFFSSPIMEVFLKRGLKGVLQDIMTLSGALSFIKCILLGINFDSAFRIKNSLSPGNVTSLLCPIEAGQSFKYRLYLAINPPARHTLLACLHHISLLRATVHGLLIIYPKQVVGYPFEPSVEEHVIESIGFETSMTLKDVKDSGGDPPGSNAYILNGVHAINVTKGKKYLLRIINATLNMENFFGVANHAMTVVEMDGEYTKPFDTSFLMLTSP
ncbi:laccase-6-like [Durio zibethinus]|uniref:Laccase-6-like n=1 Tax=Durio zibethinus TaxID=66656 RepID=A0A6P6BAL8_DURZI|nr:laccase-6-like [Durio zibethinus]